MTRRLALVAAGGVFVVGCVASRWAEQRGCEKTEALLRGDGTVQLTAIEVRYQQRRVLCSDPQALRYLEGCFREGDPLPPNSAGLTYRLRLQFAGGGDTEVTTYWGKYGFRLFMPYQATDIGEEPRGGALLTSPMPASVKEMLDFLNDDSHEAHGKALILEPEGSRRERDDSLKR